MEPMNRRNFLKLGAEVVGGLTALLAGVSPSEAKTPQLGEVNFQNYLDVLQDLLNMNEFEEVSSLYQNSKNIEVPIGKHVLEELASAFTHDIEHAYLLFADSTGVISSAVLAPLARASKMSYGLDNKETDAIVQENEGKGLTFVGTYHNHTRTKEKIEKKQWDIDNVYGFKTKYAHQENAPSPSDIAYFRRPLEYAFQTEDGNPVPSEHLWKRKERVMLIGGFNSDTFDFEVRAFTATHHTHGFKEGPFQVSPKGDQFYAKLRNEHRQYQRFGRSGCVEFSIKPV